MAPVALIPDASMVVKLLVPEAGSDLAAELRDLQVRDEATMAAPSLMFYEVANALRFAKATAGRPLEDLLGVLFDFEIEEVRPTRDSLGKAAERSRALGLSVYDATYLVLAEEREGLVVTADRRFEAKAKSKRVALLEKAHRELVG